MTGLHFPQVIAITLHSPDLFPTNTHFSRIIPRQNYYRFNGKPGSNYISSLGCWWHRMTTTHHAILPTVAYGHAAYALAIPLCQSGPLCVECLFWLLVKRKVCGDEMVSRWANAHGQHGHFHGVSSSQPICIWCIKWCVKNSTGEYRWLLLLLLWSNP